MRGEEAGGRARHYPESGGLGSTAVLRYDVGVMGEARHGHDTPGAPGKGGGEGRRADLLKWLPSLFVHCEVSMFKCLPVYQHRYISLSVCSSIFLFVDLDA